jgi:hypothetical protein
MTGRLSTCGKRETTRLAVLTTRHMSRNALLQHSFKKNPRREAGVLRFQPKAEKERSRRCEQQPSPNARETRPPDQNHEGASFAFCATFSRGWPGQLAPRCLGVFTTGSPDSPAGRPDGPKVSHGSQSRVSRRAGCRVKAGSVSLERSLPPGSGALGRRRPVDLEHDVPARVVGLAPPLPRLRVRATSPAPAQTARSRRARCGA